MKPHSFPVYPVPRLIPVLPGGLEPLALQGRRGLRIHALLPGRAASVEGHDGGAGVGAALGADPGQNDGNWRIFSVCACVF